MYTIIYYLISSKQGLTNLILKFILSLVMVYVSFAPKSIKEELKMLVFFYLTSFVFGGAALGVIYMINTKNINKEWCDYRKLYVKNYSNWICNCVFDYNYSI